MKQRISYSLTETIVRKAIKEIKDSPERSLRNLIDMALQFSEGPFQQRFFKIAQTMLRNEQSAYYKILPDLVDSVDTERLVTFGMNLGYNACVEGSKKIRKIESEEHFNIPWSLSLQIGSDETKFKIYHDVMCQGIELGISAWILYSMDNLELINKLIAEFPSCAFLILVPPDQITEGSLDELSSMYHVMVGVQVMPYAEQACQLLRSRRFLYSLCYFYDSKEIDSILSGDVFSDAEQMHPAFTMLRAKKTCTGEEQKKVSEFITEVRNEQKYKTIPLDLIGDFHLIDSIVSDEACTAGFDLKGQLYTFDQREYAASENMFQKSLKELLKTNFSK